MSVWTILGPVAPFKGGVAQHTTELAHRLTARGDYVVVESWHRQYPKRFYPGDTQTADGDYRPYERVVRQLSWNRPDTWWRTARRIRRRRGSLVLVGATPFQFPIYLFILVFAGSRVRSRVTLIAHNVKPHESTCLDRQLSRLLFRMVKLVVTHSDHERCEALRLGAEATCVRLPVHFSGSYLPRQGTRVPGLVAFIGFVRPYKGLDLLIRALASTPRHMRLEVLGEFWTSENEMFDLISEVGVADRCTVRTGYAQNVDVVELLDRCSVLVLPYRSATSSQLPRLAFLRGTPVITTNVGDLGQQVEHGRDGLVCEPTVESLYDALCVVADSTQWEQLASGVEMPSVDKEWSDYCRSFAN